MAERSRGTRQTDIIDTPFSVTLRTQVWLIGAIATAMSGSTYALYQLHAKSDATAAVAAQALANTRAMECDVQDIRNFIIYKQRPDGKCRERQAAMI